MSVTYGVTDIRTLTGLHMKHYTVSLLGLALLTAAAGCQQDIHDFDAPSVPVGKDMTKYWYSRTRSAAENEAMNRHHALGFSYDAVSGEKCNVADVRCQVLNLDYLKKNDLYSESSQPVIVDSCEVRRGVNECMQMTTWSVDLSEDLILYKGDHRKDYTLRENITDSTLIFRQTIGLQTGSKSVNLDYLLDGVNGIKGELKKHPDEILSDNFRYAVTKLKNAGENLAVIDSFVNIFGTHVVTRISQGGSFSLSLRTSKRNVTSYLQEEEFKKSVTKFIVKIEKVESSKHHKTYRNIFKSAVMSLNVKGGDVSIFDNLVADPYYENEQATPGNYEKWISTVEESAGDGWSDRSELIDMEVSPIWEFIPDKTIATRVKGRILTGAETMRTIYGELNYTNARIDVPGTDSRRLDFKPHNLSDPELFTGICHTLTDASGRPCKTVAVTYEEYIPELAEKGLNSMAVVTYPVYENRIQLDEGIGKSIGSDGKWYSIKWLYDRYVVKEMPDSGDGTLYLYNGKLYPAAPHAGDALFEPTRHLPDYAWPGSLDTSGNPTTATRVYPVRKFLNQFYLYHDSPGYQGTDGKCPLFLNLPGWSINDEDTELISEYYTSGYFSRNDLSEAFRESGIKSGTTHRMVRNGNYRYSIIPSELF